MVLVMAMEDYESLVPKLEEEENLISALKHIVGALTSNKNLTEDVKKIMADLGSQLTSMTAIKDDMVECVKIGIKEQLSIVEEKIMSWEANASMIWDSSPDEAVQYLIAVDEARKLTERLENQCFNRKEEKHLLHRAYDVLHIAMQRLEKEFIHMLVQHRLPFEPENMSSLSSEDDGDDSFKESMCIGLVHPDVVRDLKCIASSMFMSNHGLECCQAYVVVRKEALDECLINLEMENLGIEDVLMMEWGALDSKIKKWVGAMKDFVRSYLTGEKQLCDQVFAELGSGDLACFVEAAKDPMLQLLKFAKAISMGSHLPEKLVRILDMYEVLDVLLPDIDALFADEAGSYVRVEYREVFKRLDDSVMVAFNEFETAIETNTSTIPFAGGGIHHLTRYVMNYILLLADYKDTLNFLLKNHTNKDLSGSCCAMAVHLRSLASVLEDKLDEKSKLYKDASLQHLFLMNNIHYIAQKVKNSELRHIFEDDWIRKCNGKIQQHMMDYERATWSLIVSLLKDESKSSPGSISRTLLKERLRSFYLAFEEVYKTQTAWLIPDVELREDLQISISLKVIQAYRTFVGRRMYLIGEKHVKYNAEDVEDYLLDLFEGSQKSLQRK